MKSSTFITIALLTSYSIAHPYREHVLHRHKRQDVWATDYVTKTIDITTTIWIQEGSVPSSSVTLLTDFLKGSYTTSIAPSASTSSSSTYDFGVSVLTLTPTASATTATTEYNPAEAASSAIPSSSGRECSLGSPCEGDITYYTAGLGACGIISDGNIQNVVALPYGLMGPESNDNPYCGKTITITCIATGKITIATVVDKCMGCDGFSIDLSEAAFLDLDDLVVGRTSASWYFN